MIEPAEQRRLLAMARKVLEARVRGGGAPPIDDPDPGGMPAGAFVTIHRRGHLRGCLGRIERDWPLTRVVMHLAASVADSDPRFEPVTPDELPDIDIEISLLTPERPIVSIEEIAIGRHGVIVSHGRRRGLLLPQVASERGWDARTFVEHTCQKAGLAPDAWQNGARLSVFEALVFGERPA